MNRLFAIVLLAPLVLRAATSLTTTTMTVGEIRGPQAGETGALYKAHVAADIVGEGLIEMTPTLFGRLRLMGALFAVVALLPACLNAASTGAPHVAPSADPMFRNETAGNYVLRQSNPVLGLGIQQLDRGWHGWARATVGLGTFGLRTLWP